MAKIGAADLAVFLAIAKHRSFSRAAVELGVTPSALSHALRGIEERLDLRLVNRTTRSVSLTEAGAQLFNRVRPAFLDIEDALEDLNSFRSEPTGNLRLNAARVAARLALLPIVMRFQQRYPKVGVELVVEEALVDTVSGGFDAGVRFGELIALDMIAVPIGPRHRFAVVASPDLVARHGIPTTPHELPLHPCIRYRFASGAFYRWEFERGGIELEIDAQGGLTLGDQDLMVPAALNGAGWAYVFEALVSEPLADGRLVRALADWCPFYPGFYLYYPSRRQLPAALRAFIDFVKEEGG